MISLTKIGNLKLGVVKNGKPIQTTRILVTHATKEGSENFKILEGFNQEGEEKVNISLPFDSIDLNFEVNYVGFLTINEKEYISKSIGIGEPLYFYPLNIEDFDLPVINAGVLTEKEIEFYNMELTGFLKCMLDGVSGFGEVFYFKTKSINSIRAIKDQLEILSALTDGKLAGIPLCLKPIKKDVKEKQVLYVSISFDQNILFDLGDYIEERAYDLINISAFEKLYRTSREPNNLVLLEDIKKEEKNEIKIEKDIEQEIKEIEAQAEASNAIQTEEEKELLTLIENVKMSMPIPTKTLLAVYKSFKDTQLFLDFISKEKLTMAECLRQIKTENGKDESNKKEAGVAKTKKTKQED